MAKSKKQKLLEESNYWDEADTSEFVEGLERVDEPIVDARAPKKVISMRLDPETIVQGKRIARRLDMSYQALFRFFIESGIVSHLENASLLEFAAQARTQQFEIQGPDGQPIIVSSQIASFSGRGSSLGDLSQLRDVPSLPLGRTGFPTIEAES